MKRAFVVGGSPEAVAPRHLRPGPADTVIAADYGAHRARAWGWPVHMLVGDLDSLSAESTTAEAQAGTPIIRVPAAKDQTDLELALEYALAEAPDAIVICGALGGRTDHLLANVLMLARADLARHDVFLADGNQTLRLLSAPDGIKGRMEVLGERGDLLTLLPLFEDAIGVETQHLRFPLHAETLRLGEARGVSNVFEGEHANISLRRGSLLVVHISKES